MNLLDATVKSPFSVDLLVIFGEDPNSYNACGQGLWWEKGS